MGPCTIEKFSSPTGYGPPRCLPASHSLVLIGTAEAVLYSGAGIESATDRQTLIGHR